jgi:hypothetical protein
MSAPTVAARLLSGAQVDEVNEELAAHGIAPLPTGFATRPVIAFRAPATEPKPERFRFHAWHNPLTGLYYVNGETFDASGTEIVWGSGS